MDTHNPVVTTTTTTDNRICTIDKGDAANGIAIKNIALQCKSEK